MSDTRGLLRRRYLLLGIWVAVLGGVVLHASPGAGGDWQTFKEGAQLLFSGHTVTWQRGFVEVHGGGLHLYAEHPAIQIGPLALAYAEFAGLFGSATRYLTALTGLALFLPCLALLESAARRRAYLTEQRLQSATLVGGMLLAYSWVQATVQWRHMDDLFVATAIAVAIWAVAHERPWLLGVAVGLGVAAKPTALLLLPLLLAVKGRRRVSVLTGLTVIAVAWLPFVVAGNGALGAGVPQIPVEAGSGLAGLGLPVGAAAPSLLRLVQLGVGLALGAFLVVRGSPWCAPLAAFGVRFVLDPGVASYYPVCLLLACVAADLHARRAWTAGLRTVVGWALLALPYRLPGMHRWITVATDHQQMMTVGGTAVLVLVAVGSGVRRRPVPDVRPAPHSQPVLQTS